MSINFNGTNSYVEVRLINNISGAVSLSCWFNRDVLGVTSGIVAVANTTIDRNLSMGLNATNNLQALPRSGDSQPATSTGTISQNTWHHGLVVFPSQTSRSVYLDGGNKVTSNVSSSFHDGAHMTYAGGRRTTGRSLYFDGKIAEFAIWNAALTDSDALSLSTGIKPYLIKPESLIFYNPMIRDNIDLFQTQGMSGSFVTSNISVADHPRRYG